jgi:hypothetical protein
MKGFKMNVRALPAIFKPFYDEPDGILFCTRLGKNRAYAKKLVDAACLVKDDYLAGLRMIEHGPPDEPNGSFAHSLILEAAVKIVGKEGASLFAEMLDWPWVIENRQLGFILLEGLRLGGRENIPAIQEYCRRIKLEKSGPDPSNLLSLAGKVMAACMLRGFSDVSSCQTCQPKSLEIPDCSGYVK